MSTSPLIQIQPKTSPARLPSNGKRFFIWTIGCQMNEADSAKVAAMLQEVGYEPARTEQDADIVVLNSCVVRQAAEDKVTGKLNSLVRLKRERPEVPVVLTGCMVTKQQEKLRETFPHVDLFFDPSDFDKLQQVVPELAELEDDLQQLPHYYLPQQMSDSAAVTYIPIIYGRNFLCSYCIALPAWQGNQPAAGGYRARGQRVVATGVREVTLLGQTVNAWGRPSRAPQPGETARR